MQRTKNLFGLGGKSSSMDLKAEVKRLMFSADKEKEPILVTTDPGKFTMVMSAFTTYEKQVCMRKSIPYSGKLSREKIFTNFAIFPPSAKVFSTKF